MSKMTDNILAWLKSFPSSLKWLNTIKSKDTLAIYTKSLHLYCTAVNKNPDELIALKIEGLKNVASAIEFQAEDLLDNFLYDETTDLTINIKLAVLNATKSFYNANRRELNKVGEKLTKPEPEKRTPKMKDILEMEEAMTYQRDKSMLWFIESTSCRAGTVIKLNRKDLKPTSELLKAVREELMGQITRSVEEDAAIAKDVPYYMVIESERLKGAGRGKYRGIKQVCFLHSHAAKKLKIYDEELKRRDIEITPDSPIFVAFESNQHNRKGDRLTQIQSIFWGASMVAWGGEEGKGFSAHDLRDVLQGALENANIHTNIASPMLAHKVKGVDKHYSNHEIEEFLLAFRKALPWLLPHTIEQTNARLIDEQNRIAELERELSEIRELYNQAKPLIEQIDDISEFLDKRREEKWAADEARRQEQDEEERDRSQKTAKK